MIMPHNLYLHSALVLSRDICPEEGQSTASKKREAIALFTLESATALLVSFFINAAVVSVFAQGFYGTAKAAEVGLGSAAFYLADLAGSPAMGTVWALGLLAAGQSSTMTGAYAGQWAMAGYLDLQIDPWKRAILTRGVALVPTLFVATLFKAHELDDLNVLLNIIQSLVLPFTAVPLVTFASSRPVMGAFVLAPRASLA